MQKNGAIECPSCKSLDLEKNVNKGGKTVFTCQDCGHVYHAES